jgi:septum formation protein
MIGFEDFKVIPDTSDEHLTPGLPPEEQVYKLALQKAENVSFSCDTDDVIIAADTLVYLDGEPLGKPESRLNAEAMLGRLSGRKHTVYTGIVLLKGDTHVTCTEKTDVYFREISSSEIAAYAETDEPMDKAGSYAAQGRGALFVERIEGDFFNIMGLPLCRLFLMLKDFGVIFKEIV